MNHEYEEISEEFLEGTFDQARHREVTKRFRVAKDVKPEVLNKTDQGFTKVYVEDKES